MANHSKIDGTITGYAPTAKPIGKDEMSAPSLKNDDTADNAERGNCTAASEQKGVMTRANSGDVANRRARYTY